MSAGIWCRLHREPRFGAWLKFPEMKIALLKIKLTLETHLLEIVQDRKCVYTSENLRTNEKAKAYVTD